MTHASVSLMGSGEGECLGLQGPRVGSQHLGSKLWAVCGSDQVTERATQATCLKWYHSGPGLPGWDFMMLGQRLRFSSRVSKALHSHGGLVL